MERARKLKPLLNRIPDIQRGVSQQREHILTNTILIGQVPPISIAMKEDDVEKSAVNLRARTLLDRMAELGVDEVASDASGNPVGIIKGSAETDRCIVVAAHMDTVYHFEQEAHLAIDDKVISGPGIIDNSISLGILLSLPELIRALDLRFDCDIVIVGLNESIGAKNLSSIRRFLDNWKRPIAAGIILEGAELGRLNYFSRSMSRYEISCEIPMKSGWENKYGSNAILIINDVINRILEIHLPQRPQTQIIIGKIEGGIKHGDLALTGELGLEIESASNEMVQAISRKIEDIVDSIAHEYLVDLRIKKISGVDAARLEYTHPLVKNTIEILETLKIKPIIESSESELSIFLNHKIPAITIGLTHGENYHTENASAEIEPLVQGVTQLLAVLQSIDKGVTDEQ
ncbi:M20/M25/M40 family metallo-hydrolase [Spirochaeta lutea]|uniref:Peptidase M20 dimerisation domain-containing protein n=1 Tax=Spirochaeta lutea TaxID=1480694 RepID=A0A098QV04_9SPIO|nr:M20/M25/M40 family metallo-hydrolase [Spirochaeta lutea]KGE71564.1 hypothetical protein DC28_09740 [Spirochaeta lutea]